MNKSDLKLAVIVILISLIVILGFNLFEKKGDKQALVYYANDLVLKIDLSIKELKEYTVHGFNGDVLIVSENGKVKVEQEISPLHLCSKQGWIEKSYEMIVCLPNRIVIKIDTLEEVDAIAK